MSSYEKGKLRQVQLFNQNRDLIQKEITSLADRFNQDWKKVSKHLEKNLKFKLSPSFLRHNYKDIVAKRHLKEKFEFTLELISLIGKFGKDWNVIAQ
eukprot:CAMPEP_0114599076 /NCGR_PEP_ID=MMETSP0125-20121206/21522_1 /TAXON_ID=485358 ORGANISM="Aristerostoma sp., Strain ATCC 50986" /NCGR_SAMPLE_ID=MMETSP0125 /ASSEMBLY_ACC=CAM_ASM_000245 /LENGTH=96 /DNA_ID=CAMNT_0001805597 /DNA_START=311 /DNA_END=601 /DNA_ORIENTATION=+